jgi:protein tyrosine phosphatase
MVKLSFSNPLISEPDFDKINKGHVLSEHSGEMYRKGLTVHLGSRANNVGNKEVSVIDSDGVCRRNRIANAHTLYQLKTGPNKGKFLGANIFDFSEQNHNGACQKYIASEAPFSVDDYYRMIIDTKTRVLVSLTQAGDTKEYRDFIPSDNFHLIKRTIVEFDDIKIECTEELVDANLITKKLKVKEPSKQPYNIIHLIYKNWPDADKLKSFTVNELVNVMKTIDKCQAELNATEKNPICVNCMYGFGRTGAFILMHQLYKMLTPLIHETKDLQKLLPAEVDIEPMIYTIQSKLAKGAAAEHTQAIKEFANAVIEEKINKGRHTKDLSKRTSKEIEITY